MAESDLERHRLKCPAYLMLLADRAQPWFAEGINAGPDCGTVLPAAPPELAAALGGSDSGRARRAAFAASLGEQAFMQLVQRVQAAHKEVRERGTSGALHLALAAGFARRAQLHSCAPPPVRCH